MNRFLLFAASTLVAFGCNTNSTSTPQANTHVDDSIASAEVKSDTKAEPERPIEHWRDQIGKSVTLTGKAVNRKVGAFLNGDGFGIYIDLPHTHWPSGLYHGGDDGEMVRVTGTVAQRADLPVFVSEPNTLPIQGIPVPKGTDLNEAAQRYILESVEWKRFTDGTEQSDEPKSR